MCILCVFVSYSIVVLLWTRLGRSDGIEVKSLGPIFLQCFDTVGWVIWPVKTRAWCPIIFWWDIKPCCIYLRYLSLQKLQTYDQNTSVLTSTVKFELWELCLCRIFIEEEHIFFLNLKRMHMRTIYSVRHKATSFYFCNNFVNYYYYLSHSYSI